MIIKFDDEIFVSSLKRLEFVNVEVEFAFKAGVEMRRILGVN